MPEHTKTEILKLTAQIVVAHVSKNQLGTEGLSALIQSVHQALSTTGTPEAAPEPLTPAVPWKKSVFPDFIICLEDGRKMKVLKGYLKSSFNLTPAQYRTKWGLPADYPMTAPGYSSVRSAQAKRTGLGQLKPASSEPPVTMVRARRAKGSRG